jgi:hypothetical protein
MSTNYETPHYTVFSSLLLHVPLGPKCVRQYPLNLCSSLRTRPSFIPVQNTYVYNYNFVHLILRVYIMLLQTVRERVVMINMFSR